MKQYNDVRFHRLFRHIILFLENVHCKMRGYNRGINIQCSVILEFWVSSLYVGYQRKMTVELHFLQHRSKSIIQNSFWDCWYSKFQHIVPCIDYLIRSVQLEYTTIVRYMGLQNDAIDHILMYMMCFGKKTKYAPI